MSWQPIETAPKDGTKIDIWVSDFTVGPGGSVTVKDVGRVTDVFWDVERHYYPGGDPRIGDEPGWVATEYGVNAEGVEYGGCRATHWMPLPESPND